jgi:hypothetical protein
MLIQIAGWAGAAMVLAAYFLVSTKRLPGDSFLFQFLNLFGSALILINSFHFGALPSVVVNGVWILIAAFSLYRARRPRP